MRKSRHTEIAIELEQVITITRHSSDLFDRCPACGLKVVITLEEGSSLMSISVLGLVRMVEAHQVHFIEIKAGLIRLCLRSLLEAMEAATSNHTHSPAGPDPARI